MIKKLALLVLFVAFISAPALAGNIPEFDAVGDDSANYFNDFIKKMVVANNIDTSNVVINKYSDFTSYLYPCGCLPREFFYTNASGPDPSHCFPEYDDYKSPPWAPITFQWRITLQMMPETDLDLNIRDCVLKENQTDIWLYAQQTGRWRQTNGKLVFAKNKNPRVTVKARAGLRHNHCRWFFMDGRTMPQLRVKSLDNILYTSKALWEEGIVMKLPEPGKFNQDGQPVFVLREGDILDVTIDIPWNNPVDIYYGPDNVVIKYVGIVGMDLTTLDL